MLQIGNCSLKGAAAASWAWNLHIPKRFVRDLRVKSLRLCARKRSCEAQAKGKSLFSLAQRMENLAWSCKAIKDNNLGYLDTGEAQLSVRPGAGKSI